MAPGSTPSSGPPGGSGSTAPPAPSSRGGGCPATTDHTVPVSGSTTAHASVTNWCASVLAWTRRSRRAVAPSSAAPRSPASSRSGSTIRNPAWRVAIRSDAPIPLPTTSATATRRRPPRSAAWYVSPETSRLGRQRAATSRPGSVGSAVGSSRAWTSRASRTSSRSRSRSTRSSTRSAVSSAPTARAASAAVKSVVSASGVQSSAAKAGGPSRTAPRVTSPARSGTTHRQPSARSAASSRGVGAVRVQRA